VQYGDRLVSTFLPTSLLLLALCLGACNSGGSSSSSSPAGVDATESSGQQFGAPTRTQIRPGVEVSSRNGSCTSNFLYAANSATVYIGVAAHCFSEDTNSGTDPCKARNEALGFDGITIENARHPGTLAYSSWAAMQQNGEQSGSDLCALNDFALVQIHADDLANVHPAAIGFGGPKALFVGLAAVGDTVYSYGQSPAHGGVNDLEKKRGRITQVVAGGLAYRVSSDSAGLPGDSGSAVLHQDGRALAVLSDVGFGVGVAPVSNGVVNLERALNYAKTGGFIPASTSLVTWAEFSP
jgi:hypothetical protein